MNTTKLLHKALVITKQTVIAGNVKNKWGICGNVDYHVRNMLGDSFLVDCILSDLMQDWSNFSGNCVYPVDGRSNYQFERNNKILWFNPKRLALLDWLIEQTKS